MLKEEHRLLQEMLREFAAQRLAPYAAQWDREHRFPVEQLKELAAMGAFGIAVPEQWGGAGMDTTAIAVALEEIAAGDGGTSTIVSVNNSPVCAILMRYASDQQKEQWLRPLASGRWLGCFCLTEPQAGSDASDLRCRAVRDCDGWVISGVKKFITSGKNADVAIVAT